MNTRFQTCLQFVLQWEGGKCDDPLDRGGRTNCGVTQRVYETAHHDRDVFTATADEISDIYWLEYWLAAKCNLMPEPLDLCVFDSAVQHGPGQAIKFLQEALGVDSDGECGPVTLAAVQACDVAVVVNNFLAIRAKYYQRIVNHVPSQVRFKNGWDNRMAALTERVEHELRMA